MTPVERVTRALERMEQVPRPEVWIHLREQEQALTDARVIEDRLAAGEDLPLAGVTVAVKDNIDVAGLPTTAACPSFAYTSACDAPAVAWLRAAGAIVLGKTNMDQFAIGLTGSHSPYGAVRDARAPARASGGSSSGSAVAVALGHAELALGTDTAGSGRVPAAFQGLVGLKPTRGLVSTRGVVPACRLFDCVSVFARTVPAAELALQTIARPHADDPLSRRWRLDAPLGASPRPRVAVAALKQLELLSPAAKQAFARAVARLRTLGADLVEIDVEPLLRAGELLYGGAFVAERYAAVGEFIADHRGDVDPTVAAIILEAESITAHRYVADLARLDEHRLSARAAMAGCEALLLPTAPHQPTIEEVAAAPVELNWRLGTYAAFCNLLDMRSRGPRRQGRRRLLRRDAVRPRVPRSRGMRSGAAVHVRRYGQRSRRRPARAVRDPTACGRGSPERPAAERRAHWSWRAATRTRAHRAELQALSARDDASEAGARAR